MVLTISSDTTYNDPDSTFENRHRIRHVYSNAADPNVESGSPELITQLSKQHSGRQIMNISIQYLIQHADTTNDTIDINIHQRYKQIASEIDSTSSGTNNSR